MAVLHTAARIAATVGLAGIVTFYSWPAAALKLTPFVVQFAPKGADANQVFQVENELSEPAAVQVSMKHREADIDGRDTMTDAEDDFAVFPPQFVLMPHETRAVRVQWLGDPAPKSELPYRIICEQLPVDLDRDKTQRPRIKVLMRYEGSVYITPPGSKSDVAVERAAPVKDDKGRQMLEIVLKNQGTAHTQLMEPKLKLTSDVDNGTVTLSGEALESIDSQNVLAGHERRFRLPWPAGLTLGAIHASLDYRPQS